MVHGLCSVATWAVLVRLPSLTQAIVHMGDLVYNNYNGC
jgi:hypothetical protein